jgi:peptidoglycan/LPS O-acetylase OafA/YrhL
MKIILQLALGVVAVILVISFVMVKVCGPTIARNIFLVFGFLATGLDICVLGSRNWKSKFRAARYASMLQYVGATSLLACLAATAVGFVAAAAVALFAAAVFIFFFIFPDKQIPIDSGKSWDYLTPILVGLGALGIYVATCVAFLIATYLNQ